MYSNEYMFTSNVYIGKRSIAPRLYKVIKILTIVYILFVLFQIIMDGFSFEIIKDNYLMIALLLFSNNNTKFKEKFSLANVKVNIDSDEILIAYEGIDKEDKKGAMNEKFTFKYKNISKIQYCEKNKCVNIIGFPVREFIYLADKERNKNIENYLEKNIEKNILVLLNDANKKEILEKIKSKSGVNIEILN